VASVHGVTLELRGAEAVPRLEADENKLRRVLDNLVKNAIEALGEGPGEVTISVIAPSAEKARITVEDNGPGIPATVQVFRLFETTKEHGSGLGLAVSKQIVLAHGGDLLFTAREPNGTAFHVELPRQRLPS
jgi:signal transduction histidine kinase